MQTQDEDHLHDWAIGNTLRKNPAADRRGNEFARLNFSHGTQEEHSKHRVAQKSPRREGSPLGDHARY